LTVKEWLEYVTGEERITIRTFIPITSPDIKSMDIASKKFLEKDK